MNLLATPTTDITGTVTYACSGQPGDQAVVCVGIGPTTVPSSSYNPRYLAPGTGTQGLAFNVYKDPARTQVWGDFSSAS
ncbi:hypothetical protein CDEF62S_03257 [Castellaniella defragrans]